MARLLRVVPELMILVKGMFAAVRSVFFTIILLFGLMYVFSIALRQLCGEELERRYFSSVPATFYILLMHGCLLDGPKEIADALKQAQPMLLPIYLFFVLLAAMTIL